MSSLMLFMKPMKLGHRTFSELTFGLVKTDFRIVAERKRKMGKNLRDDFMIVTPTVKELEVEVKAETVKESLNNLKGIYIKPNQ